MGSWADEQDRGPHPDAKRLDWLESFAASVWCNYALAPETFTVELDTSFMDGGRKRAWHGGTLREAIDNAITGEREP
jgi:hypothetical protein